MKALKSIGLLKMDFLGLTTLTVLHDAVKMIRANAASKVDHRRPAAGRPETYKLFHARRYDGRLPV